MKSILKYLFLTIVTVLFWNCADSSISADPEDGRMTMSFSENEYHANISAPDSQLCLPRQVSYSNVQRVQSSSRRTNVVHRNNFEFIKSGKEINADLMYLIQKKSIIIHSSLIRPSNRLLSLGRLII